MKNALKETFKPESVKWFAINMQRFSKQIVGKTIGKKRSPSGLGGTNTNHV
jgi:hypothetical protein